MNTPTPLPYGEAFEQLREVLEALQPDLQPVFLDYIAAGSKNGVAIAKELTHATGIPLADDEAGQLRRKLLRAEREHDPLSWIDAEAALQSIGHGLDVTALLMALKPIFPIARQMRWISPTDGEPSPSNEGGTGGPSA